MSTLQLRDGVLGDYFQFPVYEIDFAGMLANLSGAFTTDSGTYTGSGNNGKDFDTLGSGDDVLYVHRARITSNSLFQYMPSTIPHQRNQYGFPTGVDGAICNFNTNIQRGTTYPYAAYGMTEVTGGQPSDFNTNFHYAWFDTQNSRGFDGGYSRVGNTYAPTDSWQTDSNYKNVLDVNCSMFHQLYTGVGMCHFSVVKKPALYSYYSSSLSWYPPGIGVCVDRSGSADSTDVKWCMCNKNNNPLRNMANGRRYGYALYAPTSPSYGSGENEYTQKQNVWQFFVHYQIEGRDFYGICQATFTTGWNDADYPTKIDLLTLGTEFWGGSILPSGGGGEGEWGSKTVRGGGSGTFSHPASVRDADPVNGITLTIVNDLNETSKKLFGDFTATTTTKGIMTLATLVESQNESQLNRFINSIYNEDFWTSWNNTQNNPFSSIPVVHLLPSFATNTAATSSDFLSAAGRNLSYREEGTEIFATCYRIREFTRIFSHKIDLSNLYFDAFPDYDGYTKMKLHIPYIGEVDINPNWCMGGYLQLSIIVDAMNGNMAAWVWCQDRDGNSDYMQIATGNCSVSVPIASISRDASSIGKIVSGALAVIGGAAAIAAAPVTGGGSLLVGGALGIAGGAATAVGGALDMEHKRTSEIRYDRSGNVGAMSERRVWLEITRPVWVEPPNYQKLYGLPCYMGETIMTCPQKADSSRTQAFQGFLQIDAIDLTGIDTMTNEEKEMLENELKKGVFIDYDHIGD